MNKVCFAALALAATVAFAAPAGAEQFKVKLDGKSEVPPNASSATGSADIYYDPASKKLSWKLDYSGLSGPPTAAHFNGPADVGKNALIVITIPDIEPDHNEGSAILTDSEAAQLLAGEYYLNIDTDTNRDGEIRGQIK